jgi:hypothetical protein
VLRALGAEADAADTTEEAPASGAARFELQ